ncbi:MAG: primosomal protein N' [Lachnospiraceae bacterium]|nr:primosomal protein N' [Lachnospiraceae bacterium]
MRYANIIVNISHESVDRPFTYRIPEELREAIIPGTRVKVPFGKGNKLIEGYVIALTDEADYEDDRIKAIDSVVLTQNAGEGKLITLASFIRKRYGSTMIMALKTVLPVKKTYRISNRKKPTGLAEALTEPVVSDNNEIILNTEQKSVLDDFTGEYKRGIRGTYLIHGVTGSGKTEVYIEMVKLIVSQGKTAIVLIPEISLTYQTVRRFRKYFGDRVAFIHSGLAAGTRYEYCEMAKNGKLDVIIGPRSALFTPFDNIGIIIIDEEHEGTYKSETSPKYHATEVADFLCGLHGASLVLGSATPSVISYYHALRGDYKLYTLSSRAKVSKLPSVHTVDLRNELKEGNRSVFSRKLLELMEDRLNKGEQIMLFINRRGYAGFVSCRACGHVMKCPHCDVSLSEHRSTNTLVCHYCGYEMPKPQKCPTCGSKYIMGFRAGTEQIETEVHKFFPKAVTLRMDGDTTKTKDSYDRILGAFDRHEADVLIGTQMIVKGHDFANVTLVGILAADLSLCSGDYRAGERTFQLITQAAGRAGRGDKEGEVVIQTYQPGHYSIVHASHQDYISFYEEELEYRRLGNYPPARNIMAVLIMGKNEDSAFMLATGLGNMIRSRVGSDKVIGPGRAGIGKISDMYRFVMYIKDEETDRLSDYKDMMEAWLEEHKGEELVSFDINPMSAY